MPSNADKLHQSGVLNKDNYTQDNIDAMNSLSEDELAHIGAVHKKLTAGENSTSKLLGFPL